LSWQHTVQSALHVESVAEGAVATEPLREMRKTFAADGTVLSAHKPTEKSWAISSVNKQLISILTPFPEN
jgi:hypothetical protein